MDLLDRLRVRADDLARATNIEGVRAAIRHIQAAERHFKRASEEGDEEALNDVIYRTNQAFEGMLKEAFSVLTNSDGSKKSPYEIEKHLLDKNVLAERVLVLFKNYRQEWRNPSTHDHRLFFDEQEALLAIVSVSAFANILLDQIVEAVSYAAEQRALAETPPAAAPSETKKTEHPLGHQVAHFLTQFAVSQHQGVTEDDGAPSGRPSEFAIIGQLSAFLATVAPDLEIIREPMVGDDRHLRPDLLVKRGKESTVIEVKATSPRARSIARAVEQVRAYLTAGNFSDGTLFFAPYGGYTDVSVAEIWFESAGLSRVIRVISSASASDDLWHDLAEYASSNVSSAPVEKLLPGTYRSVAADKAADPLR